MQCRGGATLYIGNHTNSLVAFYWISCVALFSYVNSLLGFFALRIGRFLRGDVLFFFLFVVIDKVLVFFVISHGCYYFGVCVCFGWWLVVRVGFFMGGIFFVGGLTCSLHRDLLIYKLTVTYDGQQCPRGGY